MDVVKEQIAFFKRKLKKSKNKRKRPASQKAGQKRKNGSRQPEGASKKRTINPEKKKFPYNDSPVKKKAAPVSEGKSVQPVKKKKKRKRKLTQEEILLRKRKKRQETIKEVIKFIVPVLLLASLVFFIILKTSPHMVDGDSMKPTLLDKDKVIVYQNDKPQRYDVVTFKPPVKTPYQYVKRIIGMPGDKIWVQDNYLYINQQADVLPESVTSIEDLPDGTIKVNISEESVEQLADKDEIPKGYYFVLGDNRTNSSDSREFGLIHQSSIEGTVVLRFSPFSRISIIK